MVKQKSVVLSDLQKRMNTNAWKADYSSTELYELYSTLFVQTCEGAKGESGPAVVAVLNNRGDAESVKEAVPILQAVRINR